MQGVFRTSLLFFFVLLGGGSFALEGNAQAEVQSFFVENSYDLYGRKTIEATLVREDRYLYFYAEKSWWEERSFKEQNDLRIALAELGLEFQNHIYPKLTSAFGAEPKPGIDEDEKITILIHEMGSEAGGYFRSGDVYEKLQSPSSNEREMLYLNSRYINTAQAKSFLAHEFVHLITVNQKDLLQRVSEEIWLNEARAEYASTFLGYDEEYEGSNLQRRVKDFLREPSNSVTEWLNQQEDYGAVNMFAQYLVDQYGVDVLVDSLRSSRVGISSLNEALQRNGFQENVTQVFGDWTIAVLINDCDIGARYCYKNKYLENLRVTPALYFVPAAQTIFSTYHDTALWSGNWHRLVGGGENLVVKFTGSGAGIFQIPYVLCNKQENCFVRFYSLNEEQKGEVMLSEFSANYSSLTLAPFAANMNSRPDGQRYSFSWEVSVEREGERNENELISELLARIGQLQEQVRRLQAQLAAVTGQNSVPPTGGVVSCAGFQANLSFGMKSEEVRCLQEFLKVQGHDVYPEALVTGNFLALTKQAVIRFQEKYASEILAPFGLNKGTGYVGQMTRNKINQLLGSFVLL